MVRIRSSSAFALLLVLVLGAATAGAQPTRRGGGGPVPVLAAPVAEQAVSRTLAAVGTVEPIEAVTLRAQVTGVVTEIGFREGETLRAGQLLFQIDPRPLEAALAAAEALLERDRAQAEQAQVRADRYARLVEQDYVTKEQAEEARTAAEALAAALRADEAAVAQARLNLAYAAVKAPIAGRAGALLVTRGNVVRANETALVVINQLQPIRVSFGVPGNRLGEVRRYQAEGELELRLPGLAREGEAPSGRLRFIDNAVNPATGMVTLKAEFANADEQLWPGQFLPVELVLTVEPQALTVPASAVLTGQRGPYVYVIGAENKVEQRVVTLDGEVDGFAVITAGLAAGETVVTDGQLRLVPGATVAVKTSLDAQ